MTSVSVLIYCSVSSAICLRIERGVSCDRNLMGCSECVVLWSLKINKVKVNSLSYYKAYCFCVICIIFVLSKYILKFSLHFTELQNYLLLLI